MFCRSSSQDSRPGGGGRGGRELTRFRLSSLATAAALFLTTTVSAPRLFPWPTEEKGGGGGGLESSEPRNDAVTRRLETVR